MFGKGNRREGRERESKNFLSAHFPIETGRELLVCVTEGTVIDGVEFTTNYNAIAKLSWWRNVLLSLL